MLSPWCLSKVCCARKCGEIWALGFALSFGEGFGFFVYFYQGVVEHYFLPFCNSALVLSAASSAASPGNIKVLHQDLSLFVFCNGKY